MFILTLAIVCLGSVSSVAGKPGYGYEYRQGKAVQYGGLGYKYKPKNECQVNSDCLKGYICSDNFCVPNCGPCSEFDFTTGYCKYLCAKNAKCVKERKYNYKCFCPYCPGMDGYDKYANCRPPKYLKGICYSYDRMTKALPPKHAAKDYYYSYEKGYGKGYDKDYVAEY